MLGPQIASVLSCPGETCGTGRNEMRPSLKEIGGRAAADAERQAIRLALQATRGNTSEAARLLRVDDKTLHIKIKRYGIDAAESRAS
jgi:DNA-binding NtrC family response regulator